MVQDTGSITFSYADQRLHVYAKNANSGPSRPESRMEDPADRGRVQVSAMRLLWYSGLSAVLRLKTMSASVEAIEAEFQGRGQRGVTY